jgi:hypothetical protein
MRAKKISKGLSLNITLSEGGSQYKICVGSTDAPSNIIACVKKTSVSVNINTI